MSDPLAHKRSPVAGVIHLPLRLPRAWSRRRAETLLASTLAVAGAFIIHQSVQLGLGRVGLPVPGFFPLLLGAMLFAGAGMIGVDRWRSRDAETVELGHRDVLITVTALLAVPALFEPLGTYLTLGLFGTVMLVLIARVAAPLAIAAAAVAMAACWYFFQVLLGLQIPTGPF
jgi:hypothetical protein